jgi:2-C-methyl-D-erythritol 4-phosphate cytidylyltransferase
MMKRNRYAVIVAAGIGKRMGAPIPKQFLLVAGKPLLMHTLQRLYAFDENITLLLVLHPDYFGFWQELVAEHDFAIPHQLIAGGAERFHSVKCAVDSIQDETAVVGIHDGVRPLVGMETLQRCYDTAASAGNAVPVVAVNDSVRVLEGQNNHAVDRSLYRIVQTPQCFQLSLLKEAFKQPYTSSFTDDASVMEAAGHAIQLVEGNRENIKITTPEDLRWAQCMLQLG